MHGGACLHLSMSSHLRRNSDGILTDCLCFGACCFPCPSISLLHVCHASSLSLSPPLPLPPSLPRHFSEGWEQWMDIQVPARRNYGNTALVISGRYMKLCSTTQRHNRLFLIVSLSRIQFLSLSTPPPLYLCVHVIVWQPNLSNQQIQPK